MSRKRPAEDPVGRQVRSRQRSSPAPSSNAHRNTPLFSTTSTHLAPPPITHYATSAMTQVTSTGLSSSPGASVAAIPHQSSSSATPNVSEPSHNLTPPPSAPLATGSKHKISTGFKSVFGKIDKGAKALGGISLGMSGLLESLNVIENEAKSREEYKNLRSELESLWKTLTEDFNNPSLEMTASMKNLLKGVKKEIEYAREKCDRRRMRRYAEAMDDGEDILNCSRRVQMLVNQISMNANLEIWIIVDTQLLNLSNLVWIWRMSPWLKHLVARPPKSHKLAFPDGRCATLVRFSDLAPCQRLSALGQVVLT